MEPLTANDPSTVGEASSSWNSLGNTYVEVSQGLSSAAGNSEYGWQGQAGGEGLHLLGRSGFRLGLGIIDRRAAFYM